MGFLPAGKANTDAVASPMLNAKERIGASVVAVIAGILAYRAEVSPPSITKASDSSQCTTQAAKACVVSVASDTSTIVVVLIAFSAAAALIALLGIRFTKISAAGASLESDVTSTNPSEAKQATGEELASTREEATAKRTARTQEQQDDAVFQDLPPWVKSSLVAWANTQNAVTKPIAYAVVDAAKATGKGNKPWYVTAEQDSGDTMILRVATGRGGTSIGEHDPG